MKLCKKKKIMYTILISCVFMAFSGCGTEKKEETTDKEVKPYIEATNISDEGKFYLSASGADNSFVFNLEDYNFKRVKLWVEYYYKGEKKKDYPIGEVSINDAEKLSVAIVEDDSRQLINIYASTMGNSGSKRVGPAVMEYKAPKNYLKEIKSIEGKKSIIDNKEIYIGFICKNKDAISFNEESLKGEESGESEILRNEYSYMIKAIFYNE